MKEIPSGVPARVKRWYGRTLNGLTLVMIVATMSLASTASVSAPTLVAQCIPSNDTFAGPLKPLMGAIFGALGGIIPLIASALLIIAIFIGLIKAARNEDIGGLIKIFLGILAVPFVGLFALILFNATWIVVGGFCKTTPF